MDNTNETLISLYKEMLRIRLFEEKVAELINATPKIICPVHLYIGQEAVAVGVCANLRKDDYAFSTHRSHGHYLAKGGDMKTLMAELYGKATGCSKGRGGSMHLASPEVGLLGSSAIVAGTIPLAVGTALASSLRQQDNVTVAFFGDGAVDEGVFYESLNFASLMQLPIIFVCENNMYATHMPIDKHLADTNIYKKAEVFNIWSLRVDGNDIAKVLLASQEAIKRARQDNSPTFIECLTYRWRGHVGANHDIDKGLRSQEELDYWMKKCPIKRLEAFLFKHNIISQTHQTEITKAIHKEIKEAITFARTSPYPNHEIHNNVFKD